MTKRQPDPTWPFRGAQSTKHPEHSLSSSIRGLHATKAASSHNLFTLHVRNRCRTSLNTSGDDSIDGLEDVKKDTALANALYILHHLTDICRGVPKGRQKAEIGDIKSDVLHTVLGP